MDPFQKGLDLQHWWTPVYYEILKRYYTFIKKVRISPQFLKSASALTKCSYTSTSALKLMLQMFFSVSYIAEQHFKVVMPTSVGWYICKFCSKTL